MSDDPKYGQLIEQPGQVEAIGRAWAHILTRAYPSTTEQDQPTDSSMPTTNKSKSDNSLVGESPSPTACTMLCSNCQGATSADGSCWCTAPTSPTDNGEGGPDDFMLLFIVAGQIEEAGHAQVRLGSAVGKGKVRLADQVRAISDRYRRMTVQRDTLLARQQKWVERFRSISLDVASMARHITALNSERDQAKDSANVALGVSACRSVHIDQLKVKLDETLTERDELQKRVDHMTAAGRWLSNAAFNLAQLEGPLTDNHRRSLKRSQEYWDAAIAGSDAGATG